MELASRKGSQNLVAGLAKCIKKESPVSTAAKAEQQRTKEGASRLYNPKKGSWYKIFNKRLIRLEIVQYCAQDVALLPRLYNIYNTKLRLPNGGGAFWQVQVQEATKDRIKLSQSLGYDRQAESKVCEPWDEWNIKQAMEAQNDEVMFNAQTSDFVLNKDDVQVDPPNKDLDDYEDNDISAWDCIGWEEDMVKNGEYF